MFNIRTGLGFDVHRLVEGRELWLCGLRIDHPLGLLGHSDADVAIHALCDALLGAAALRDIGYHFPDTDQSYKGVDSKMLLAETVGLLSGKGWKIGNVDITICAEAPRINPHIEKMQGILSSIVSQSRPRLRRNSGIRVAVKGFLRLLRLSYIVDGRPRRLLCDESSGFELLAC